MRFYCVKCRKNVDVNDPVETTMNGRRVAKAIHKSCGTKLFRFLPKK